MLLPHTPGATPEETNPFQFLRLRRPLEVEEYSTEGSTWEAKEDSAEESTGHCMPVSWQLLPTAAQALVRLVADFIAEGLIALTAELHALHALQMGGMCHLLPLIQPILNSASTLHNLCRGGRGRGRERGRGRRTGTE
jgi:hypothetical protein